MQSKDESRFNVKIHGNIIITPFSEIGIDYRQRTEVPLREEITLENIDELSKFITDTVLEKVREHYLEALLEANRVEAKNRILKRTLSKVIEAMNGN